MQDYEFRQLHFHLPNTESFLRVHSPDKYGDLLLDVRENFSAVQEFEGKDYTTNFLAIENFKGIPSAYLICVSATVRYREFMGDMYKEILLVSLLAFFIIAFGLALAFYQNKLKNSAEIDYLTNIYNRSDKY